MYLNTNVRLLSVFKTLASLIATEVSMTILRGHLKQSNQVKLYQSHTLIGSDKWIWFTWTQQQAGKC